VLRTILTRMGLAVAVLSGAAVIVSFVLEFAMCDNSIVKTAHSPDGSHTAVAFERSCGATTGFSTQVSVDPMTSRWVVGSGNAWIADSNHGAAPSAIWGGPDVQLEWLSNTELVVTHHPAARVFKAEEIVSRVKVTYASSSDAFK
jgi:hypothetical protein